MWHECTIIPFLFMNVQWSTKGIHWTMLQYCLVLLYQALCMVKNINIAIHVSFEHCMSLLNAWYLILLLV